MTTFNMAVATLMRLDNALRDCNLSSRTHQYNDWYYSIEILYKELKPYFKKGEKEIIDKLYVKCGCMISNTKGNSGINFGGVHKSLLDLEVELRGIINKRGLDFPRSGDPRNALGGGM